jgi:hypothetical protein
MSRMRIKVLPNERGDGAARPTIVVALVLQVLATLALVPLGLGGGLYLFGAAFLGALMLGWGAAGGPGAGKPPLGAGAVPAVGRLPDDLVRPATGLTRRAAG